jgi:hypothetical protein
VPIARAHESPACQAFPSTYSALALASPCLTIGRMKVRMEWGGLSQQRARLGSSRARPAEQR